MTEEQKASFKAMPLEEQLIAMYDMLSWVRGEIAVIEKNQIGFIQDLSNFKQELREVRAVREAKENETMDTNEKIAVVLNKRFAFWSALIDRVLSNVLTAVVLALLGLAFGVIHLP